MSVVHYSQSNISIVLYHKRNCLSIGNLIFLHFFLRNNILFTEKCKNVNHIYAKMYYNMSSKMQMHNEILKFKTVYTGTEVL